ncbi:hypothetical protein B0H21DRAFT_140007 [Amylocystis lapponica]|nr:hypothetical protein B0H21DRAFT_140007 [Amylocystis lapponica]
MPSGTVNDSMDVEERILGTPVELRDVATSLANVSLENASSSCSPMASSRWPHRRIRAVSRAVSLSPLAPPCGRTDHSTRKGSALVCLPGRPFPLAAALPEDRGGDPVDTARRPKTVRATTAQGVHPHHKARLRAIQGATPPRGPYAIPERMDPRAPRMDWAPKKGLAKRCSDVEDFVSSQQAPLPGWRHCLTGPYCISLYL